MARQKQRIRIAPGIYRDGDTLIGEVRIGNGATERRTRQTFPIATPIKMIQAWQHGARRDLLLIGPVVAERGTLGADIPTYLATLPAGRYKVDSAGSLQHWTRSPLATQPRYTITRLAIVTQLMRWRESGAAAATCNRRLSSLRKLFLQLDGPDTPNPTDAIKYQPGPEIEARDIPFRIVQLILESLPDQGRAEKNGHRPDVSLTKIRLRVMAWTGMAPATLQRVQSRHLDLPNARMYLTARRKGRGTPGVWVSLLPPAVDALRDFAAAKLFGVKWSGSSMRKTWQAGIARAKRSAAAVADRTHDQTWLTDLANLPPRCKPYDLRHSFASELYRRTSDIHAVGELLQHADLQTTKRYTKGAVSDRVHDAISKAAAAFADLPTLPALATLTAAQQRAVRKQTMQIVRRSAS